MDEKKNECDWESIRNNENMDEKEEVNSKESEPEPTKCEPGTILAINKNTVHKICSGQVVLTLAIAVKELVENSVDAGSTIVEIKLHDQGLESIEVSDNGSGVSESNLEAMTAKYCTSKLEQFEDLLSVETYGFRGEALSSLCSLANVTILTRHKDTHIATKIELNHSGKIVKRSSCSRAIGTTVTLKNLFKPLPVRRRDFESNVKREFTKMINMLQAYCLVAKGVRIICSNHSAKNRKTVLLQTNGGDVLANISAVFGVRQSSELLKLKPAFEDIASMTKETLLEELSQVDSKADTIRLNTDDMEQLKAGSMLFEGYISSCSHGAGRSSKDRQYFYVNSRPCDSKNLSKTVNDIYHRYNAHQNPFVFLNLITKRSDVDVNVTPDKRLLLLKNEKILLMLLKKSLLNTFINIPGQHKMENVSIASIFKVEPKSANSSFIKNEPQQEDFPNEANVIPTKEDTEIIKKEPTKETDHSIREENLFKEDALSEEEDGLVPISTAKKFMDVLSQWRQTGDTAGSAPSSGVRSKKRKHLNEIETRTLKMQKIQNYLSQEIPKSTEVPQFASYKSESESDGEDAHSNTQETSPNQSLPCIEKINQASKEYDLITSPPSVQSNNCKISGPAKSFLPFIKDKPPKYDSEGESLCGTQESLSSNVNYEDCLPSSSKAIHNTSENKLFSDEEEFNFDSESSNVKSKDCLPSTSKAIHNTSENKLLSDEEEFNFDSESSNVKSKDCLPSTFKAIHNTSENQLLSDEEEFNFDSESSNVKSKDCLPPTSKVFQIISKSKYVPNKKPLNSDSEDEFLNSKEALDERVLTIKPKKGLLKKQPLPDSDSEFDFDSDVKNITNEPSTSMSKSIVLDDDDEEIERDLDALSCMEIITSLEEITAELEAEEKCKAERRLKRENLQLRFKSDIKPSENKQAEEELRTEISKKDFVRMEIIGQFNLGFIIVKLDDDLFIVDQHASDEKYNFEKLQETTVISSQRLVVPQQIELTVVNEMVLMDHLAVFEKNGFKFQIDENAPPMRKVRLIAKPVSRNWDFGKEDIDELIFMLQDAPEGTICRPSRVRTMFASRACRKSVMIGDRLDEASMKKLITHMGEIEHPWNCPHGRPTIRHLINVAMLDESDTDSDDDFFDKHNSDCESADAGAAIETDSDGDDT